jgi:hypothetical protein
MRTINARFWMPLACGAVVLAPAFAQTADFRARITGGGGDRGLCTLVVDVDGSAEVELRGDQGRLRTLSGAPATWLKLECTQPLPPNPVAFRFIGVDGRGPIGLVREPSANRGTAVVHIDDPRPGREGYTFQLEWRGSGPVESGRRDRVDSDRRDRLDWDDQVDFRGRGDGYFRNFRGRDDLLGDCEVSINRRGEVRVAFDTNHRSRLTLTGRLIRVERDHLTAEMSGNGVRGVMRIELNGRDRVTEVSMSGEGRDRYELSWRR